MRALRIILRIISVLAVCAVIPGCGYALKGESRVRSIRIGKIENLSYEIRLADRFTEVLAEELVKKGIRMNEGAEYAISGVLTDVSLKSTAERDDLSVQYSVTVSGDFTLSGPGGMTRKLARDWEFIISFSAEGEINTVYANKDVAIREALRDLAEALVVSLESVK